MKIFHSYISYRVTTIGPTLFSPCLLCRFLMLILVEATVNVHKHLDSSQGLLSSVTLLMVLLNAVIWIRCVIKSEYACYDDDQLFTAAMNCLESS